MKALLARTMLLTVMALVVAGAAVLTVGCGGDEPEPTDTGSPTAATVPLPDSIRESGVLKVGTNMPYPPFEYYEEDGTTPTGAEVDLVEEIATRLGLEVEWDNMNWDGLVPALVSERFDMVAAALADYTDRQEIVTMVDFFQSGSAAVVMTEDEGSFTAAEDLGGRTIGVLKGSIAASQLKTLSGELESQGLEPIDLKFFPDDNAGLAAVKSGRVEAHITDVPTGAYIVQSAGGTYALVLPNLLGDPLPFGMAVRKEDTLLAEAVSTTLNDMIADGTYEEILERYGIADGALEEATINGGTTSSGE